jgi:hypothetical protein
VYNATQRSAAAALVAAGSLLFAHWFDAGVVAGAQNRYQQTYDVSPLVNLFTAAHILTAAGAIAVAWSAWWSRTWLTGIGYTIVGGLLALLPALFWACAASINGAPTVLPDPIARVLTYWYSTLQVGVTGAVYTISGAMLLVGLAVLAWNLRLRRVGRAPVPEVAAQEA